MAPPSTASESGQASVEFVAVLPALAVCLILAGQAMAAGWALWSAGVAARAGARAEKVGGNPEAVARRALPVPLRRSAAIRSDDGVRVRVRVPSLVPGVELPNVAASSTLNASAG
jgi:pilus assembly protein CpaE